MATKQELEIENAALKDRIEELEAATGDGVTIAVPLADPLPPGQSHRVHVDGHLKGAHGATMIRLRAELNRRGARLRDGRFVQTTPDALKWLLEQVEAGRNQSEESEAQK